LKFNIISHQNCIANLGKTDRHLEHIHTFSKKNAKMPRIGTI